MNFEFLLKSLGISDQWKNDVQRFVKEWFEFMQVLRKQLISVDMKLDSIDSKINFLISRPIVDENIYQESLQTFQDDPRNNGKYINDGRS